MRFLLALVVAALHTPIELPRLHHQGDERLNKHLVEGIVKNEQRGTGKRKGFCALISIGLRNAFNTARWKICIKAMVQNKLPDSQLRMIDDYLSNRWVIYEGDKWSLKEETKALLVTDRRSFQYPRIVLGEHEVG